MSSMFGPTDGLARTDCDLDGSNIVPRRDAGVAVDSVIQLVNVIRRLTDA